MYHQSITLYDVVEKYSIDENAFIKISTPFNTLNEDFFLGSQDGKVHIGQIRQKMAPNYSKLHLPNVNRAPFMK